jgi:uncharacterized protein
MKAEEIIDKYYEGQEELKELLLMHSRQVADKAMEVLDLHPEIEADRTFVYEAAMLHDIGVLKTDAPGIGCHGKHPYICHGMLGAEMLRAESLPKHARVAERHTGTGLTKATILSQGLPLPADDFSPETIEEQIVCFADKFFSKVKYLHKSRTFEQVVESMARISPESEEKVKEWAKLFL